MEDETDTARIKRIKFITELAKSKLPNGTHHKTFIDVFGHFKDVDDRSIATNETHLTAIYKRFEEDCPKLKIVKKGKKEILRKYLQDLLNNPKTDVEISDRSSIATKSENIVSEVVPITPTTSSDLLGRDADRQKLAELSQKHKLVLLKAAAGIGKSTLARYFLETQFAKVIQLEMGLEAGNVTPAEEKVSQILRKEFDEEPSRDFQTNLEILRDKLSDKLRPIGVLIDNLEPALDANSRFLEKLRGYEDLLRILGDRDVCSFTLITSRRSLIVQRVKVHEYSLQGLDIEAWREHFHDCENGATSEDLEQMCVAYNGNAKVMDILHGAIINRFGGNITAYWNRCKDTSLADAELETLISVEMDWLRDNQPDAYKLVCRMGCYRYQDVKTVPFEGLICLLWDVPESEQASVVDSLNQSHLIEFKEEYYLHPAVRAFALIRLETNKYEWEKANREAASFWTKSIIVVKNIDDALRAFEAYYFYLEIQDLSSAIKVMLQARDNIWEKDMGDGESLGYALLRLGLFATAIPAINLLVSKSEDPFELVSLYNLLGDFLWLSGELNTGLQCHMNTGDIIKRFEVSLYDPDLDNLQINLLRKKLLSSLLNKGLCYLALWDIEKACHLFLELESNVNQFASQSLIPEYQCSRFFCNVSFCLALTYSLQSDKFRASHYISLFVSMASDTYYDSWNRGYSLLFIAKAYKNIGDAYKSITYYQYAIDYAEDSGFKQVKAIANCGMGEVYQHTQSYQLSLTYLNKSISDFEKLGAKPDLAEAYFQLGLTYQAMGEQDQAKTYKDKALKLFKQMEAPKQCDRVNQAFEQAAKQ
jgi:tetratricopeptide (TPR) repeat protein